MTATATASATRQLLLLAFVAGTAMASNYVLQPVLPALGRSFPTSPWMTSLAAAAGPFGYMLGLLLLVPLGDALPGRALVAGQSLALAAALALAAMARTEALFLIALLCGGIASTVTAQCVALAGRLLPDRQGQAVGTVVMGVSIGILAGRVLAGALADPFGWRAPLVMLAALIAIGCFAILAYVPRVQAIATRSAWHDLMLGVPRAFGADGELRRATVTGCCWFAAFSSFWTALAFHLAQPPLGRGAAFAGAFGLIGIAGAIVAQVAGRASDRWGARSVVLAGLVAALMGFAILCIWPVSLVGLGIGALVMDAGCFAAQAVTQGYILRTGGTERSRRYGAYMALYWCAGALGAFTAPVLFQAKGWIGLNCVNLGLIACALILHSRKGQLAKG